MDAGSIGSMREKGITESYKLKRQVVISASEAAEMIMRCVFVIKVESETDSVLGLITLCGLRLESVKLCRGIFAESTLVRYLRCIPVTFAHYFVTNKVDLLPSNCYY